MSSERSRGFTLIELLITIAVIAVIAAVAYPSYQGSVLKSRRADAKTALTDAAQRLERYYTENNRYTGAAFCAAGVDAGCTDASRVSGTMSENRYYNIGFAASSPTATAFTIVATPQGSQSNDVCGSFTLNQIGDRRVIDGLETDWRKCW